MNTKEELSPALKLLKKEFDEFHIGGSVLQHDRDKIFDFFCEQFKLRENQSYWRSQFSVIQTEHNELSAKISHLEDANKNLRELLVTAEERGENKARAEVADNEADGYVFCGKCGKMK